MVARAVRESSRIVTSTVARAAFARLMREGILGGEEHGRVVAALDERWQTYERLAVSDSGARLAGTLAQQYELRGFDAVHPASATLAHGRSQNTRFLSFDDDLTRVAGQIVQVYEPEAR